MQSRPLDVAFRREIVKLAIDAVLKQAAGNPVNMTTAPDAVNFAYDVVDLVQKKEAGIIVQNEIDACSALAARLTELAKERNDKLFHQVCGAAMQQWQASGLLVLTMVSASIHNAIQGKTPIDSDADFMQKIIAEVEGPLVNLYAELAALKGEAP